MIAVLYWPGIKITHNTKIFYTIINGNVSYPTVLASP